MTDESKATPLVDMFISVLGHDAVAEALIRSAKEASTQSSELARLRDLCAQGERRHSNRCAEIQDLQARCEKLRAKNVALTQNVKEWERTHGETTRDLNQTISTQARAFAAQVSAMELDLVAKQREVDELLTLIEKMPTPRELADIAFCIGHLKSVFKETPLDKLSQAKSDAEKWLERATRTSSTEL